MLAPILSALTLALPQPVDLDTLSIHRANQLHGKPVAASFLVAKPIYTLQGRTVLGAADRQDDIERGGTVPGQRYDIREAHHFRFVGTLRVIRHGAAFVNGVFVPEWEEIRVVGW